VKSSLPASANKAFFDATRSELFAPGDGAATARLCPRTYGAGNLIPVRKGAQSNLRAELIERARVAPVTRQYQPNRRVDNDGISYLPDTRVQVRRYDASKGDAKHPGVELDIAACVAAPLGTRPRGAPAPATIASLVGNAPFQAPPPPPKSFPTQTRTALTHSRDVTTPATTSAPPVPGWR
jgi:hypothetical protein